MTPKRAVLTLLDAAVIGAVLGYLLAPRLRRTACALVAAGEAARIDAEWEKLNAEAR